MSTDITEITLPHILNESMLANFPETNLHSHTKPETHKTVTKFTLVDMLLYSCMNIISRFNE